MKGYIVVTGASTGIGYDTTRCLIANDYHVFGSVRNENDAAKLLNDFGDNVIPLVFDVTDEKAIKIAKEKVETILGKELLIALVNNAGIAVSGPLQFVDIKDVRHQLEVNVIGTLMVSQAFLPLLGAKQPVPTNPGKIINISSISGIFSTPFMGPYCMSKYAVESMSDIFRRELSLYGIDVVVIEPGPIATPIWDKAKSDTSQTSFVNTIYEPILNSRNEIINQNEKNALPVSSVSELILRSIEKKKPATRTIITKKTWLIKIIKALPDRWVDNLITKNIRKGKLAGR